ncbi:hypothetical protein L2E82_30346 [Cichorium intybus]|uniref:Uncharacterized protein n=1 Tax=Cichorium intybus TaxID=13427 RepID=A0ACB9D0T7_CICIN|nr:hypothetical protein L2E82_30346 [Cichorium intybus]
MFENVTAFDHAVRCRSPLCVLGRWLDEDGTKWLVGEDDGLVLSQSRLTVNTFGFLDYLIVGYCYLSDF